jgi:hypothetical protein
MSRNDISFIKILESVSSDSPVTSLQILSTKGDSYLVASNFIGQVSVYDLTEFHLFASLTSNVKVTTALAVCPA